MIHLIYVSSANSEMSEDDLLQLLEECRSRNLKQHVTGMLLYIGGNFIQVLEGEEKDVEEIYDSITRDDRHSGLIVMLKEQIKERVFPDWTMGFKHLSNENKGEVKGYTEFLEKDMKPEQIAHKANEAVMLLYSFKQNNT